MRTATMKEVLKVATEAKYLGFKLYGAGMYVTVTPGYYNGERIVGTKVHTLRRGSDGVNYYLNNGKQDVFSFNVRQGFDYEMNQLGDFTVSRDGVSCTMLTHLG